MTQVSYKVSLSGMKPMHSLSYELPEPWDSAINAWLTWLVAAGTSPATRRTRRAHIRYLAHTTVTEGPADITLIHMVSLLGREDRSQDHRRGVANSLHSFYRWALKAGVVPADPTIDLPVIRASTGAPKPATDEIWAALLANPDKRTILMARLACEVGLRRAEVAQVHFDDLILSTEGPQLIIHGKGSKQRVVPITHSLATDIIAVCPAGAFLFPGRINGHMGADRVGQIVSRAMPAGWSMHKLRHRFATRGFQGTGNLRAVQEALGHASVATTQRYTAVAARDLRAVSDAAAAS